MNKPKLKKGQIIKNHRELCSILNREYRTGSDSKKSDLKELGRYCKFHKDGHKYIIDSVFNKAKQKEDKRCFNGKHMKISKYESLMDDIILNKLENGFYTFNMLYIDEFKILNKKYKEIRQEVYKVYTEEPSMSNVFVFTYFQKLKKILEKCLQTSLNRMQRQGILEWEYSMYIHYNTKIEHVNEERLVTNEELSQIKITENLIKEREGISDYQRINPDINGEFKNFVMEELEYVFDAYVYNYYNVYNIRFLKEIDTECCKDKIKELSIKLQESICDSIQNKTFNKKNNKGWGTAVLNKPYEFSYLDNIKKLNKKMFKKYN